MAGGDSCNGAQRESRIKDGLISQTRCEVALQDSLANLLFKLTDAAKFLVAAFE